MVCQNLTETDHANSSSSSSSGGGGVDGGQEAQARFQEVSHVIYGFLLPSVCVFGMVGNLLNLTILTRRKLQKSFRTLEQAANLCLISLAVSDLMFCVFAFPSMFLPEDDLYASQGVLLTYRVYCTAVINVFIMISTWLTVAMSLERYLAICHPLRQDLYLTTRRIKIVIALTYLLSFLFNIPVLWRYQVQEICPQKDGGGGGLQGGLAGSSPTLVPLQGDLVSGSPTLDTLQGNLVGSPTLSSLQGDLVSGSPTLGSLQGDLVSGSPTMGSLQGDLVSGSPTLGSLQGDLVSGSSNPQGGLAGSNPTLVPLQGDLVGSVGTSESSSLGGEGLEDVAESVGGIMGDLVVNSTFRNFSTVTSTLRNVSEVNSTLRNSIELNSTLKNLGKVNSTLRNFIEANTTFSEANTTLRTFSEVMNSSSWAELGVEVTNTTSTFYSSTTITVTSPTEEMVMTETTQGIQSTPQAGGKNPGLVTFRPKQVFLWGSSQVDTVYRILWAVVNNVVPLLLLVYFNVCLCRKIYRSYKMRQKFKQEHHSRHENSSHVLTVTLVVIVVMFFVLVAPSEMVIHAALLTNTNNSYTYMSVEAVMNFMQSLNFSVNFVLYCIISPYFRKTLKYLFCCGCYNIYQVSKQWKKDFETSLM